jgi:uncharacterized membrane-anchored protein
MDPTQCRSQRPHRCGADGDLAAEQFNLGYARSALAFAAVIAAIAVALQLRSERGARVAASLPPGRRASSVDLFTQDANLGGPGLGTTWTSVVFLSLIVVVCLTVTR